MTVQLIECPWSGSKWNTSGGGTFTFSPDPDGVTKECQVDWMIRKSGLSNTWPKSKYRYKRTVAYSITGGCNGALRNEIEFYTMRNSKFRLIGLGNMATVEPYSERNTTFPSAHSWNSTSKPTWVRDMNPNPGAEYVIIESASFKQEPGKNDWFSYNIKLSLVDNGSVS